MRTVPSCRGLSSHGLAHRDAVGGAVHTIKVIVTAAKTWRRPKGDKLPQKVAEGATVIEGVEAVKQSTNNAQPTVTQISA